MSDYGDMCRDLKNAKQKVRAEFGQDCPMCRQLLPKACPSILLPGQRCKIHGYRDPRKRTAKSDYFRVAGFEPVKTESHTP
jgi:hypothetical protein